MRSIAIIILLVFFTEQSQAQPYYFRHYQVEDGLSNNTVISTIQDSKGFLWFGTKDGLDRFDGYNFKIYRNNPDDSNSLGNNSIWRIYEDEYKQLWIGTERGLYKYNAKTENFSLLQLCPKLEISGIVSDNKGSLWIISGFELYRYSSKENKIYRYSSSGIHSCTALAKDKYGNIWVGTMSGELVKYNKATAKFERYHVFNHSTPPASTWIEKIFPTDDGFLLIGTSNQGVKKFNLTTNTYTDLLTYNSDGTQIYARDFSEYKKGEYWIATENGIYIYETTKNNFTHIVKNNFNQYALSDNAVYAFTKDNQGGIWICTYFGGINYYPKPKLQFEKFISSPLENSIKGNAVREITQDQFGNMWIGTEDAGLNKFCPKTSMFKSFTPEDGLGHIAYTNIHGILADGDKLWIGTFEHGLDVMDIKTEKVIKHYLFGNGEHDLKSNFIYTLYKRNNGKILIGTSNGLYEYNNVDDDFTNLSFLPPYNFYSAIVEDNKNNIWIGTFRTGLFYFNKKYKIFGRLKVKQSGIDKLADYRINSLYIDRHECLWVCTENNLFRINPTTKEVRIFSVKNGLPSNLVYCIVEDNNNDYWITTSKGLVKLNADLSAVTVFTREDGLLSNQFNYSSLYKDSSGRIYCGSVKGLISFYPQILNNAEIIPSLYITNFKINNQDVNISKSGPLKQSTVYINNIELTHRQSSISFDFAALNFVAQQNIKYAYKLQGLDKGWNYINTNRSVYFTNLSPGKYQFMIKSTNANGDWVSNQKNLMITILPPWWLSNFAYFIYITFALLLAHFIIRFYHIRQTEKQKIKMANFERAKEREVYEAKLDFFTKIAHEIRTPLTLIKAPMEKLMSKAVSDEKNHKYLQVMNKNTQRLLDLTNQLLDFRKVESGEFPIHATLFNVTQLLKSIFQTFHLLAAKKNIRYNLDATEDVFIYSDEESITKIISNLLDNAIKYGKSSVTIRLKTTPHKVSITVNSDGNPINEAMQEKIFEPFFRMPEAEKATGTGIGLPLSRSLAELLKGSLSLDSTTDSNIFTLIIPKQL